MLGQVAVTFGPVVYCAEEADNGPDLHLLRLPRSAALRLAEDTYAGYRIIAADGLRLVPEGDALYSAEPGLRPEKAHLRLIPYCLWANRGKGEMSVFLRETEI